MSPKKLNKVIIIDDDLTSVYLTTVQLEDIGIFEEILTAKDGNEGLNKIMEYCLNDLTGEGHCPSLILLDINMPIMDGFEVIEQLQKMGKSSFIEENIIVLTSSSNSRDKAKMLNYGVKQYIEKPLTNNKLLPLIQASQQNRLTH